MLQPSSLWVHHKSNQKRQQQQLTHQHQHHYQYENPSHQHIRINEQQSQQQQLPQPQPQSLPSSPVATSNSGQPQRASILSNLSSLLSYPRSSSVAPTPAPSYYHHPIPHSPHSEQMQATCNLQISAVSSLASATSMHPGGAESASLHSIKSAMSRNPATASSAVATVLPALSAQISAAAGLARPKDAVASQFSAGAPSREKFQAEAPYGASLHMAERPTPTTPLLAARTSHRPKRVTGKHSQEPSQPLPTPQLLPPSHKQRATVQAASTRTAIRFRAGPVAESLDQQTPFSQPQPHTEDILQAQTNPLNRRPNNSFQQRVPVAEESKAEQGTGGDFVHGGVSPWEGSLQDPNSVDILRVNLASPASPRTRGSDLSAFRPPMTLGVVSSSTKPPEFALQAWAESKDLKGHEAVDLSRHSSIPLSEQTAGGGHRNSPELWSFWRLLQRHFRRERIEQPELARRSRSGGTDPAALGEPALSIVV